MFRLTVIILVLGLGWTNLISDCFADIYMWTDKSGTTHVTDNPSDVPSEYKDKYHFTAPSPLGGPTKTTGSIEIPFDKTLEGLIVVAVVLNEGVKSNMILDTGANLVVVTEELSERLNQKPSSGGEVARLRTNCGEIEGRHLVINKVAVGDAWKENVPSIVALNSSMLKGLDGLLGLSFLGDFKITVDYQTNRIILTKSF